jgi:hypothetical protein
VIADPTVPTHLRPWLSHALKGAWDAADIVHSALKGASLDGSASSGAATAAQPPTEPPVPHQRTNAL